MRRILGAWPRKTAFGLLIAAWSGSAPSEVTLDGTLGGARGPLPGPHFKIGADLGRQVGRNLFHSFGVFNINDPERATFTPNGSSRPISNVLSRVTGGSASTIDGALNSTIPDANLFFLNPAGVVFGKHASLNVQGSFHASTADFIRLADEVQFNAAPSANDALLSTASPAAFGFLGHHPAPMAFQDSKLEVAEGQTLSVVGGKIAINGGSLKAPGGQVNVASVASAGEVTLGGAELGTGSFARLGKIDMTQGSSIDVSEARNRATGGGRVLIRGGRFVMDNSEVLADTKEGDSKGIDIKLTDALVMKKGAIIRTNTKGSGNGGELQVEAQDILLDGAFLSAKNDDKKASGDAGQIAVLAGRLRLREGSVISAITDGLGLGGNIVIKAGEVVLEGGSKVGKRFIPSAISANTLGPGRGGEITITAGHLRLTEGAKIRVSTEGPGPGGNLTIKAGEIVLEKTQLFIGDEGKPTIFARSLGKDCGDKTCGPGGTITIKAERLQLKDGAEISVNTFGSGKGGKLSIYAKEVILENGRRRLKEESEMDMDDVSESTLTANAQACGKDCGDGGSITIEAERLQLKRGAFIEASTDTLGKGGNIKITADEVALEGRFDSSVREEGFEAVLFTRTRGDGDGGNITIKAGRLQLKGDAEIGATSGELDSERGLLVGHGNAGRIHIETDTLEINDGAAVTTTTIGHGHAGTIRITKAARIKLINGGTIASESGLSDPKGKLIAGKGNAGSVFIDTTNMEVRDGGSITTTTRGPGIGGTIEVTANEIMLQGRDSTISASTFGPGEGGKVSITAADLELRDGASITSESRSGGDHAGQSGEISIRASDSFRLFNDSHITVETNRADAGDIGLDVGFLLHLRDSSITTSVAGGQGDGGNINIDPVFVVLDNSKIIANALRGSGGNIHIVSDFFFASPDSIVDASSGDPELSGTVEIESPDTDLNAGLIELPADFFDAATLLTQGCAPGADLSRLLVRKYEVLPDSPAALRVPPPGGLLNADAQSAGFALTRETLGPGFEDSSGCDGDG